MVRPDTKAKKIESWVDQPSRRPTSTPSAVIRPSRNDKMGHTTPNPVRSPATKFLLSVREGMRSPNCEMGHNGIAEETTPDAAVRRTDNRLMSEDRSGCGLTQSAVWCLAQAVNHCGGGCGESPAKVTLVKQRLRKP